MPHAKRLSEEAMAAREERRANQVLSRHFRVVGPKKINGASEGEEIYMDVTPAQARHLIDAGLVAPMPSEAIETVTPIDDANPTGPKKRRNPATN
jgi:hypothetical protein